MITEKITGMSLMPEEAKKTTSRRETEALHNRGCRAGSEAAGLEECSGDVVGEVEEAECGASEVF